jgi:hypothetical protein
VYVQVSQIQTLPHGDFRLWGEVLPITLPLSSVLQYDSQSRSHSMKSHIELAAGRRYGSVLALRIQPNSLGRSVIATASLPLDWFPADQTVEDWFPFYVSPSSPHGVLGLIRVHIAKRFDLTAFTAPPGNLLVLPAWNRPTKPIIPPTPFFDPIPPGFSRLTVAQGGYPRAINQDQRVRQLQQAGYGAITHPQPAFPPPFSQSQVSYDPPSVNIELTSNQQSPGFQTYDFPPAPEYPNSADIPWLEDYTPNPK